MFHIVNVKRVVLSLLFRSYHRIWRLQFLIRRQSWLDILSAGEEVFDDDLKNNARSYNIMI